MIHVWLVNQQGTLRVWNDTADSKSQPSIQNWMTVESFQALNNLSFIKPNDKDVCLYLATQSFLSLESTHTNAQLKQLGISGQQYLFEDVTLSPVEQLRVRHMGAKSNSTALSLYALSETVIERWQKSLQLSGLNLSALLPDFLLLPVPAQTLTDTDHDLPKTAVLFEDLSYSNYLIRFSEAHGMSLSHINLLPRILDALDEVLYLNSDEVVETLGNQIDEDADNQGLTEDTSFNTLKKRLDDSGIVLLPAAQGLTPLHLPIKHSLNFVQAQRHNLASPYLVLAASLLLMAGVVQIAADALQSYQYSQAVAATEAATSRQFAAWFSGQKLNTHQDIEKQVQPYLVSEADGNQPQLALLNQIAPLIKQAGQSTALTAQTIGWQDNGIQLVLQSARRDVIDTLYQSLVSQGIAANLGAVNTTPDGGVVAEINIALTADTDTEESTS